MENYQTIIKGRHQTSSFIFFIFSVVGILIAVRQDHNESYKYLVFVAIMTVFGLYNLWSFIGNVKVDLDVKTLNINKRIFGVSFHKQHFDLSEISKMRHETNVKGKSYWNLADTQYTPEFLRVYDINPTILSFEVKGNTIEIGERLEKFNADEIIKEIKKRQI